MNTPFLSRHILHYYHGAKSQGFISYYSRAAIVVWNSRLFDINNATKYSTAWVTYISSPTKTLSLIRASGAHNTGNCLPGRKTQLRTWRG
jgi:hypothetical protein